MPSPLNNKRILENTLALYFRQIITMCVSLYTSRIVLSELGVTDFGINVVIGSLITICSFISGTFIQTLNRFFSFELGKGNYEKLNKIFNISIVFFVIIALISFSIAETIGLWFLQNKMVIPLDRANSALWVYEFSIFGMILGLINTPYISIVICREKFKVFAYMSIFDAVMKLAVVYLLVVTNFDKLKLLSVLNFSVGCLSFIIYQKYCRSNFKETTFKFCKEKDIYIDMLKFSRWIFLNPISFIAKYQGVNMVLNIFFGPAVNAARGIAFSVNAAVASFTENATQAVNPQIIKLYASGNFKDMWNLIIRASKMYYLLFFTLALPIILNTQFILEIWLASVPKYAVIFVQLVLVEQIIKTLFVPLHQVNNASGNIKIFQIIHNSILVSNLPVAIILCYLGFSPQSVFVAGLIIMILFIFSMGLVIKKINDLPLLRFVKELFLPIFIVTISSIIIPLIMHYYLPKENLYFVLNIFSCIIFTCSIIYYFGLSKDEREKIVGLVKRKIHVSFF